MYVSRHYEVRRRALICLESALWCDVVSAGQDDHCADQWQQKQRQYTRYPLSMNYEWASLKPWLIAETAQLPPYWVTQLWKGRPVVSIAYRASSWQRNINLAQMSCADDHDDELRRAQINRGGIRHHWYWFYKHCDRILLAIGPWGLGDRPLGLPSRPSIPAFHPGLPEEETIHTDCPGGNWNNHTLGFLIQSVPGTPWRLLVHLWKFHDRCLSQTLGYWMSNQYHISFCV